MQVLPRDTLITPVQCKSIWRQFKAETEYAVAQAISMQVYIFSVASQLLIMLEGQCLHNYDPCMFTVLIGMQVGLTRKPTSI